MTHAPRGPTVPPWGRAHATVWEPLRHTNRLLYNNIVNVSTNLIRKFLKLRSWCETTISHLVTFDVKALIFVLK